MNYPKQVQVLKEGGNRMLKFDLTRKYLVGFLTLAMVLSLFALPVAADVGPIVNVGETVGLVRDTAITQTLPAGIHTLTATIRDGGGLIPTATYWVLFQVSLNSVVQAAKTVMVPASIGTATVAFARNNPTGFVPTATTYQAVAYWVATNTTNSTGALASSTAAGLIWATTTGTILTASPATDINVIPATGTSTHIVNVTVTSSIGVPITLGITVNARVASGIGTVSPLLRGETATSPYTFTLTINNALVTTSSISVLEFWTGTGTSGEAGNDTVTATKTWVRQGVFDSVTTAITPSVAYNLLSSAGPNTHTVTVLFKDQFGNSFSATSALQLVVTRPDLTKTATVDFGNATTPTTYAATTYTNTWGAGTDIITVTGTIANTLFLGASALTATKVWGYGPGVGPDNAVNVLGATHNFVITGAPLEVVKFTFVSAGIFSMNDLMLAGKAGGAMLITDGAHTYTPTFPHRASNMDYATIVLDATGSATISVYAQAPGKFYMDTWFYPLTTAGVVVRTDTIMIKVSKAYAKLHVLTINPASEINPITQVPTWDVHTVTVMVGGEFPATRDTIVPGGLPPEGGTYVIKGENELWAINVPIRNARVGWEVKWTDQTVNRVYVDSYAAPKGATGSKYAPGIAPFWFTAFSTTDANGVASLTYNLAWGGVGTPTVGTCTYYFPCLNDTITATAGYGEAHLDGQYKTQTTTVTKEWRDHAFKLIKYNGHIPIAFTDLIPGAKFFLRRVDLGKTLTTTSPIYVPPMPLGLGWTSAPTTGAPGNAYIVAPGDTTIGFGSNAREGVVTTDTYGEALWSHLPYGIYGLYEYSVPTPYTLKPGTLFTFTINATAPYWCGPEPKITIRYETNSPTSPGFDKITYCGTAVVGAKFDVTNLETGETHEVISGALGHVTINLGLFNPIYNGTLAENWYKITETETAGFPDIYTVADFYFFLNNSGGWDNKFYNDTNGSFEVWPINTIPWAWDSVNARHWVVDPKIGTPPMQPRSVALSLRNGWNLVGVGVGTAQTIEALFGSNFQAAWVWDPITSLYDWMGSVAPTPGRGFWVYMNATGTVTITGIEVSSPQTLSLAAGWNMIANPFEVAIPWTKVKLNGAALTPATYAFSYNGTVYQPVTFTTGTLPIGEGYWILMTSAGTIEFSR
jgi:hypothetical protein